MMCRLATVGKDKDGWKKADEHLTILMDQEHMITIEDTDAAIKQCEQHLQRSATDEGSPFVAKVLATEVEISGQDTAIQLAALKATAKAQDAKIKALSAQLRATHRVPSVHAAAIQWTRSLSQCALCVANGDTMPRIVRTSSTPTKPS